MQMFLNDLVGTCCKISTGSNGQYEDLPLVWASFPISNRYTFRLLLLYDTSVLCDFSSCWLDLPWELLISQMMLVKGEILSDFAFFYLKSHRP